MTTSTSRKCYIALLALISVSGMTFGESEKYGTVIGIDLGTTYSW